MDTEEKVCDFAFENDWITQYQSLLQQVPSTMSIRALEPSYILVMKMDKIEKLAAEMPKSKTNH